MKGALHEDDLNFYTIFQDAGTPTPHDSNYPKPEKRNLKPQTPKPKAQTLNPNRKGGFRVSSVVFMLNLGFRV